MKNDVSTALTDSTLLDSRVDLSGVSRKLKDAVPAAVQKLKSLLGSGDPKVQLGAAKALIELHVEVEKHISQDQFARALAEHRKNAPMLQQSGAPTVVLDFNSIPNNE